MQDTLAALSDVVQRQFAVLSASLRALQQQAKAADERATDAAVGPDDGDQEQGLSSGDRRPLVPPVNVPSAR